MQRRNDRIVLFGSFDNVCGAVASAELPAFVIGVEVKVNDVAFDKTAGIFGNTVAVKILAIVADDDKLAAKGNESGVNRDGTDLDGGAGKGGAPTVALAGIACGFDVKHVDELIFLAIQVQNTGVVVVLGNDIKVASVMVGSSDIHGVDSAPGDDLVHGLNSNLGTQQGAGDLDSVFVADFIILNLNTFAALSDKGGFAVGHQIAGYKLGAKGDRSLNGDYLGMTGDNFDGAVFGEFFVESHGKLVVIGYGNAQLVKQLTKGLGVSNGIVFIFTINHMNGFGAGNVDLVPAFFKIFNCNNVILTGRVLQAVKHVIG